MRYAIGLDVGGTKIEGALVSENGKVLKKQRLPTTPEEGLDHVIDVIALLVKELSTKPIVGIGIGWPGYAVNGNIVNSPNITCALHKPLGQMLRQKLKKKVFIENDANCFALAETTWGASKGKHHVVGLIVGTGVGSGIIINGQIYSGALGGAGEVGETPFVFEPFNVEHLLSGPGIENRYFEITQEKKTVQEIVKLKTTEAKKVMTDTEELLGWLLGNIMNTLNPQAIVLGGGISNIPFYGAIKVTAKKYALPFNYSSCTILKNKLGDSSGALGAASLVFSQH